MPTLAMLDVAIYRAYVQLLEARRHNDPDGLEREKVIDALLDQRLILMESR